MLCIPALLIKGPTLPCCPGGSSWPWGGWELWGDSAATRLWGGTELAGEATKLSLRHRDNCGAQMAPGSPAQPGARGTPLSQGPLLSLTPLSLQVRTADMGGYSTSMDFTQAVIDALEV